MGKEQMSVLYTVGFSGKDAKTFFELLKLNNVQTLLDVRLNNVSQLSGYTKKNDLTYFLDKICGIEYKHLPILAPSKEILDSYKSKKMSWNDYEIKYMRLINERKVENELKNIDFDRACLLCNEKTAEQCHRRLAANIIKDMFMAEKIIHL